MLHISTFIIWFLITGSSRRARMTQVKSRALQPARLYSGLLPRALLRNRNCCTRGVWSPELHPCSSQTPSSSPSPLRMFKILSLNQTSSLTKNIRGPQQRDRASFGSEGWEMLLRSFKPLRPDQPYRKGVSKGHPSTLALPSLCSLCFLGKEDKLPLESTPTL